MRILQIGAGDFFSTYGGGQVYVKNLVDAFINHKKNESGNAVTGNGNDKDKNGIEISVISFVSGIEVPRLKNYRGINLWELPSNPSEEILTDIIVKINPEVIHAHSMKHLVCRVGDKLKIPVVVTAHHGGILCPAGTRMNCKDEICRVKVNHKDCLPCVLRNTRTGLTLWYPFMKYLPEKSYQKLGNFLKNKPFIPFITPIGIAANSIKGKKEQWQEIVDKCTVMIAPCDEIAEAMTSNGLSKNKVKVIGHGIPLPNSRTPFPEIKDGKIKFFYVGRICYVKGIHILLEAFSNVDNSNIELHLIGGAGNKSERRYMNSLQKKYVKDKRIVWHDKIVAEEIFDYIKKYHISSSSSSYLEAFGLNIAESLAIGKPVLVSRCGGGEMQIKDGFNGWLVPQNDVNTLAEKIKWITRNPEILSGMSKNCSAKSIVEHVKEFYQLYSSLNN